MRKNRAGKCKQGAALLLALVYVFTLSFEWISFSSKAVTLVASNPGTENDYTWGTVNIGGGGFITGIVSAKSNSDVQYARSDVGGAYRWNSKGRVWESLSFGTAKEELNELGVESIAVDPLDANKVYMAVGQTYNNSNGFLLASQNGGATWSKYEMPCIIGGNSGARNVGERLTIDPITPTTLYFGGRNGVLYQSLDSGVTWKEKHTFTGCESANGTNVGIAMVMVEPKTSDVIVGTYAKTNQFYRSNNEGDTFTGLDCTKIAGYYPQKYDYDETNSRMIIAFAAADVENAGNTTKGCVGYLNINTNAFTTSVLPNTDNTAGGQPVAGVAVYDKNPDYLIATSFATNGRYGSVKGDTYGTHIFLSKNGGTTWVDVNKDLGITLTDGGRPWSLDASPHWSGTVVFNQGNLNQAFMSSGNGIYELKYLFDDSKKKVCQFTSDGIEESVTLDMVSPASGADVISVAYDTGGFICENDMIPPTSRIAGQPVDVTGIAVSQNKPSVMAYCQTKDQYYGDGSSMYESLHFSFDGGQSWTAVRGSKNLGDRGSCALSANGDYLYWIPSASGARYTENVGTTLYVYKVENNSFQVTPKKYALSLESTTGVRVMCDTVNNSLVYISSDAGLSYSQDMGATFSTISDNTSDSLKRMTVVPGKEGEVWGAYGFGSNAGLLQYSVPEKSVVTCAKITGCEAVGFGKGISETAYPAMYIYGKIEGKEGIYRSVDKGSTWLQINDENTQFAGPGNGLQIVGSQKVFGKIYMTNSGLGLIKGEPASVTANDVAIELSQETLSMETTDVTKVKAYVYEAGNKVANGITWTSSNADVATVTGGMITGIGAGKSTITAAYKGKKATLLVTVTNRKNFYSLYPENTVVSITGTGENAKKIGFTIPEEIDSKEEFESKGVERLEVSFTVNSGTVGGFLYLSNNDDYNWQMNETTGKEYGLTKGTTKKWTWDDISNSFEWGNGTMMNEHGMQLEGTGEVTINYARLYLSSVAASTVTESDADIYGITESGGTGSTQSGGNSMQNISKTPTDTLLLSAPKSFKTSCKKKKTLVMSWKKVKGAKKYIVYYCKKKKGIYKKLVSTSKNKIVLKKKIKSGRKYYIKVVAVNSNGIPGKFSKIRKQKIK